MKATVLSIVLLTNYECPLAAQEAPLPPLPGGGETKPRELTPEEREAQRKAQEAVWRANAEAFRPFLHPAALIDWDQLRLLAAEEEAREAGALAHARALHEQQLAAHATARRLARERGILVKADSPDGQGASVDYLDGQLAAIRSFNADAAKTISTDKVLPGGSSGLNLDGSGVMLGLWDERDPLFTHWEFTNATGLRIINGDGVQLPDAIDHATQVAGTMISAGVSNSLAKGMAPNARLNAFDFVGDAGELGITAVTNKVRFSAHPYGLKIGWNQDGGTFVWYGQFGPGLDPNEDHKFGRYGEQAYRFDTVVYTNRYVLPVLGAGIDRGQSGPSNPSIPHQHFHQSGTFTDTHFPDGAINGGYDTINEFATAKNALTVGTILDLPNGWQSAGAVTGATFTCWGPTDDGRIKPDLVANGTTITTTVKHPVSGYPDYGSGAAGDSYAVGSVAGSLALLQQHLANLTGTLKKLWASTYKALVIHTADEAGPVGPDYQTGWGVMNTLRSLQLLSANYTNVAAVGPLQNPHLKEFILTNGTHRDIAVSLSSAGTLKVTLAHSDPGGYYAGSPQVDRTNHMLVNRLHLKVLGSGGAEYLPYLLDPANPSAVAGYGSNVVDNVQQVRTNLPAGIYTIRVSHSGTLLTGPGGLTTNQPVSLIISGNAVVAKPPLEILSIAQTGATNVTLSWPTYVGLKYKVQALNEVTEPATSWYDLTGATTATSNPMAVQVAYSGAIDKRFFRVVEVED